MQLIGRERELQQLRSLKSKKVASLVVVQGRRRIGKSSLVQHFGRSFKHFIEFQGLAPRPTITRADQLASFSEQFCKIFRCSREPFSNWSSAFTALHERTKSKEVLIFLDEISWLGIGDSDFAGTLKIAWDTQFSHNSQSMVVLCGSVSSWIEENILKDAGFVGRVSLVLRLRELALNECAQFWGTRAGRISVDEKLKLLCVTGGVPKYLSELTFSDSADENIKRLCFTRGGYLFEDFDRIFSDIFGKRSELYLKIVRSLLISPMTTSEVAKKLGRSVDRQFSSYIKDLELSGYISRDSAQERNAKLRISDNYLRFYLRYILPHTPAITQQLFSFLKLEDLMGWDSIIGLQFENLILNRLPEIVHALGLGDEKIIHASPYTQRRTTRHKACQIDLLITCKNNTYYVCEIKFKRIITKSVIEELERKITTLSVPRRSSLRPVLIYAGALDSSVVENDYFDRILDVGKLLGE